MWGSDVREAPHLNQKHKQRNGGWCIVVLLKLVVTKVVSLSFHDSAHLAVFCCQWGSASAFW